ncbi:murein biosynthesis integral membrane protein MurJ [Hathewaya histolytica]|uniref:murein biosynthesis integral membrane protein MurJ n=1 Tax=Hathewaya histolytica TaxID=1498 RepID=UPI003B680977
MKVRKKSVLVSIGLISILTILSKGFGLLRDVFTAAKFGAGRELDIFFAASNIPMILFMAIGTAISTTFIPLYNDKKYEGQEKALEFTNNVLNVFIIVTAIISIICMIFSKPISIFLNPGFKGDKLIETALLTKILLPTLILNSIIYVFNAFLQSQESFTVPSMISLPLNITIILYLLLFGKKYGILGLTIITFIATMMQIIPQIYSIRKRGYKYKFYVNLKDKLLIKMGIMILPVLLGTSVQQINSFVERGFAGNYSSGSLSALNYAYRVFIIFVDIFAVAISTVIYPIMSRQISDNNLEGMKNTLMKYLINLIILILPISIIVMIQSRSIIFILFERGAFTKESTMITSGVLFFYVIGILAYGIRDFLCKAFYTIKDTKTPMINSGFAMFINIILIIVLQKLIGLNGIALANAISTYIACFLLFISLTKKLKDISTKPILICIIKTLTASSFMACVIIVLNNLLKINLDSKVIVFFKISVSSLVGILVFIIVGYFINIKTIRDIIDYVKNSKLNREV